MTHITPDDCCGYVYFIAAPASGLIKIGKSQNPRARFSGIQTGSPEKLEFLGQIITSGADALERELHNDFAHLRVRGEWFVNDPAILAVVDELGDVMPWEMGEADWRLPSPPQDRLTGGRKAHLARYLQARGLER